MAWFTQRNIIVAAGLAALLAFCYWFSDIVAYILLAWVLSVLTRPVFIFFMTYMRAGKYAIGRDGAALLALLSVMLLMMAVIGLFVPVVMMQANTISGIDYKTLATSLDEPIRLLDNKVHELGLVPQGQSITAVLYETIAKYFTPATVSNFFSSAVAAAGNVAIGLVSVFFIAYYFLIDSKLFNGIITTVVPRSYEANASHAINESVSLLFSYFRGLLLQVAFVAVYVSGLLFVLGVPNALLIGVLTALLNVIPYVGPIISSVIAGLLTVSSSLGMDFFAEIVPLLLKVAGVIATMQMLDNFIVQPYIFSKSVQAHPLEIFFVVMIGAQVAGITGMIIAIPVYTVLRVFARVFWSEYKIVQRLTGHLDDD